MSTLSTPQDFKKKTRKEIILPSGMVIRVKKLGSLQALMGSGSIPNPLMKYVSEALDTGVETLTEKVNQAPDLAELTEIQQLVDRVNLDCWLSPELHSPPQDDHDRDEDLLYSDEVGDEDKLFVFQWVIGGVEDVAQFRQEYKDAMGSMGSV